MACSGTWSQPTPKGEEGRASRDQGSVCQRDGVVFEDLFLGDGGVGLASVGEADVEGLGAVGGGYRVGGGFRGAWGPLATVVGYPARDGATYGLGAEEDHPLDGEHPTPVLRAGQQLREGGGRGHERHGCQAEAGGGGHQVGGVITVRCTDGSDDRADAQYREQRGEGRGASTERAFDEQWGDTGRLWANRPTTAIKHQGYNQFGDGAGA